MRSEMSPLLQGAVYHSRKSFAVAKYNADTVRTAPTYLTFVSECSGVTRLSGISIVMSQRHLQVHVDVLSDAFKHDSNGQNGANHQQDLARAGRTPAFQGCFHRNCT